MIRRPPRSTLSPYTTRYRSGVRGKGSNSFYDASSHVWFLPPHPNPLPQGEGTRSQPHHKPSDAEARKPVERPPSPRGERAGVRGKGSNSLYDASSHVWFLPPHP